MLKNRNTDAQSLVILILVYFMCMLANVLFNLKIDFIDYLIFFIAWRVMVMEEETRKATYKINEWFRS